MVKKARALTAVDAGYHDIKVEPRTSNLEQRRADIFFVDARGMKTFHHYTDDVVSHPHSPAHHLGERSDPYHAMGKSETRKAGSYRTQCWGWQVHHSWEGYPERFQLRTICKPAASATDITVDHFKC